MSPDRARPTKNLTRCLAPLAVLALSLLAAPAVAGASTSYQGSDRSYNSFDRHVMYTCDEESDETKVKANYKRNNGSYGDVYDVDGNNGNCASGRVDLANSTHYVVEHKTCEYRSAWPDQCGNWVAAL